MAAASFHGGDLAPDDANGLQHRVGDIAGEISVAHADNDGSMPPEQQERLAAAFDEHGVTATTELYAGASHGFTMSDVAVYDSAAEQRHWDALLGLLARRTPVSG